MSKDYFVIVDYNHMQFVAVRSLTLEEANARAAETLARRKRLWNRGARPKVFVCQVLEVLS